MDDTDDRPRARRLAGLTAAFLAALVLPPSALAARAPLVVDTAQGKIQGSIESNTRRFAGVRYAQAPEGDLRWAPPRVPARHDGIAPATAFGSQCPQADGNSPGDNEQGDLDCLFLNIYTPVDGAARLPVMLFIHGGSDVTGTGSIYVPATMVRQGKVIVVTINYRLGLEGSLALPALDAENPATGSGDYGLLDAQAALEWVRVNIANFGGDPDNITLFGESAGAAAVCENVASPFTAGRFTGAIAESGCNLPGPARPDAEALGLQAAAKAGCAANGVVDLACLRAQTPAAITKAGMAVGASNGHAWGGPALPLPPLAAFPAGRFNRVPLVVGSNADEGRLFAYSGYFGVPPVTNGLYRRDLTLYVTPVTGLTADEIVAVYPASSYSSPLEAYSAVIGDAFLSCPTLLSDISAAPFTRVSSYEFSDPGASLLGATHAAELPYLFDLGAKFTDEQQALSTEMIGYWTNFARSHTPNGPGVDRWPGYPKIQNLAPLQVGPFQYGAFVAGHHCDFWATGSYGAGQEAKPVR